MTIPTNVSIDKLTTLPKSWRDSPPSEATQSAGSRWAKQASAALLRVPSILVPGEHNLLINPLHPQFKRLKISKPEPFEFDGRLWKGKQPASKPK